MAGEIKRIQRVEEAGEVVTGIPVRRFLQTTGIPIVPTETAGNFNLSWSANVLTIQGEVTDNETEVSVGIIQFTLPQEYVAGEPVSIRFPAALINSGGAVNNGSAVTVTAYRQENGAVGGDIVASGSPFTFAADGVWYDKDVVLTPTTLNPGDVINVGISASIIDSDGGAGTLRLNLGLPKVVLTVQG